jgi:hypothetical protein
LIVCHAYANSDNSGVQDTADIVNYTTGCNYKSTDANYNSICNLDSTASKRKRNDNNYNFNSIDADIACDNFIHNNYNSNSTWRQRPIQRRPVKQLLLPRHRQRLQYNHQLQLHL